MKKLELKWEFLFLIGNSSTKQTHEQGVDIMKNTFTFLFLIGNSSTKNVK